MKSRLLLALGVVAASSAASAQDARTYRLEPGVRAYAYSTSDENRAVIGISPSGGSSSRDTLGLLIGSVTPGSPAEKSGLEEGNRIASINGVNLKLAPADVGDWDMSNAMSRRLTREMGRLKPGDEVDLRVYGSGQTRTVKIKTVAADSLYRTTRSRRDDGDDRAALGVSLGSYGSKRDTLGVLLMGIDDDGPAGKAGLEEGNRIAAINGIDLRVSRDDAGDEYISGAKVRRLQRELEKLKPGDEVTLRVYGGGRTRDVKVKTVAQSSLSRRGRAFFFGGGTPFVAPMPPMPPAINFERRRVEERLEEMGRRLEEIGPRIQRSLNRVIM